jgi:thiamine pyrophosphokinase
MTDNVVIVTGASPLHPRAVRSLPRPAIVLAADGGLDHARAAGLTPAGLVGDLDSITPEGLAWAQDHATIQRHPTDKDDTDTELALAVAADLHPAHLVLVAGSGPDDRLDHLLATLGALATPVVTSIPRVECWLGTQHAVIVHGPGRARLTTEPGDRISLVALRGPCTGVTVTGTQWVLEAAELEPLAGRGVSNLADASSVEVSVSTGVLAVFHEPVEHGEVAS